MGEVTSIAWTDRTFNPWIGCTKVSAGCTHCYAEAQDHRWGHKRWGVGALRERTSEANWKQPVKWNKDARLKGVRYRVFCASMADVFDADVPPEWRADLFALIEATPYLDWQLLTKRPENILRLAPRQYRTPHVWIGTTVENEDVKHARITALQDVPRPRFRFLSCEPLLGPIDLSPLYLQGIDWVIIGGESGPHSRPMDLAWARGIQAQCKAAGVACFVKQLGVKPSWGDVHGVPVRLQLADSKGGDPAEWPDDLRVREFPRSAA